MKSKMFGVVVVLVMMGICSYQFPALREHPFVILGLGFTSIVLWLGYQLFRNPLGKRGP